MLNVFDPHNWLEQMPLADSPLVSAVILNWKRSDNVNVIIEKLVDKSYIDEVIVWNNSVDPFVPELENAKIRVIDSDKNLRDISKYKACSQAKNQVCFYQDDDWDAGNYIDGLYHAYCMRPTQLHTVTGAFTWKQNWIWTYYNDALNVHAAFSWIGCGAMFPRSMAERHLCLARKHFTEEEQEIVDSAFAVLQNQPIVQMQVTLRKLGQPDALSHIPGFEARLKQLHMKIGRLLPEFAMEENSIPRCVMRAIDGNFLLFTSFLPFERSLRTVSFDPQKESDLIYRTRDNIPYNDIKPFSNAPFTAAFIENSSKFWSARIGQEEIWGLVARRSCRIRISIDGLSESGGALCWKVMAARGEEVVRLADLSIRWFEVESAIYFQSLGDCNVELKIKVSCKFN